MNRLFKKTSDTGSSSLDIDFISGVAIRIIRRGGLVIFPTSTIYGLAGDARRADVLRKIFAIKKRSFKKAISVIIASMNELNNVAKFIPINSMLLMKKFWPGGVTFIVETCGTFPAILTAGTGNIGVRIPSNKIAMSLVKNYGSPITATSANISGEPGAVCVNDINHSILDAVSLVIDTGILKGGIGSTIVDLTVDPIHILREGTVGRSEFFK